MKPSSLTLQAIPHWVWVILLSSISGLGIFSNFIFLPSLPIIGIEFTAPDLLTKFTVAAGLLGGGMGQLILGPFSDFFGRRALTLLSLVLFIGACLGAALAPTITTLIVMRFLQGASAGTCIALMRAVVRDLFTGAEFVKFMTMIIMVISVSPAIAPILGGYLQTYFNWRASFYFLAIVTSLILALIFFIMPETNPAQHQEKLKFPHILNGVKKNYGILMRDSYFLACSVILGLVFATTIGMATMFPFIYKEFGWSVEAIGYVSGSFAIGNIVGSIISRTIADWAPGKTVVMLALILNFLLIVGGCLLISVVDMGPFLLLGFVTCMITISMVIQSNTNALALADHPERAGAASSLLGGIYIGSGAIGAILAGLIPNTIPHLILINFVIFTLCLGVFYLWVHQKR